MQIFGEPLQTFKMKEEPFLENPSPENAFLVPL